MTEGPGEYLKGPGPPTRIRYPWLAGELRNLAGE